MKCIVCGHDSLIWQDEYTSEDFGWEEDGIVQLYWCKYCGAEYQVFNYAKIPEGCERYSEEYENKEKGA